MGVQPAAREVCPVAAAARLLGDRWTLLILRDLALVPCRFTELERSTGISPRVLSRRLRMLEAQGVVTRRCYAEVPPRVEYRLTGRGMAALPVIEALRGYGMDWLLDDHT